MDDNMGDDLITGIDLNREPPLGPSPPGGIEDRITQLETVFTSARESQRLRRWDASHVAKALALDSDAKKIGDGGQINGDSDNGSFFDCNICLDMARDPILTCCGHLFCWGCFYQIPCVDSISKECPVCQGEVTGSNLIPVYGNGKNSQPLDLNFGANVPPRPHARRIKSERELRFGQWVSRNTVAVADAIRRIGIDLGFIEGNTPLQGVTVGSTSEINPQEFLNLEEEPGDDIHQQLYSEILQSFSEILESSNVIGSAERLGGSYSNNEGVTSVGFQSESEPGETNHAVPQRNAAARRRRGASGSTTLNTGEGSSPGHRRRRLRRFNARNVPIMLETFPPVSGNVTVVRPPSPSPSHPRYRDSDPQGVPMLQILLQW